MTDSVDFLGWFWEFMRIEGNGYWEVIYEVDMTKCYQH